jgi:hypothetical protein
MPLTSGASLCSFLFPFELMTRLTSVQLRVAAPHVQAKKKVALIWELSSMASMEPPYVTVDLLRACIITHYSLPSHVHVPHTIEVILCAGV